MSESETESAAPSSESEDGAGPSPESDPARAELETMVGLLDSITDGFHLTDASGRFVKFNATARKMLADQGIDAAALIGKHAGHDVFPEPHGSKAWREKLRTLKERVPTVLENYYAPWQRWFEIRNFPAADDGLVTFFHDITDRKQGEAVLAEQKQLLERIATGHPLEDCLYALTDAVSRLHPDARACVLIAGAERTVLARGYAAHFPRSFGEGVAGAPVSELAIGTCGRAILTGRPATCPDIVNSEEWSSAWRELCRAQGIAACHSVPVFRPDGPTIASFCLCFAKAREPTVWEQRIAEFGAHVASIVIERDRAAQALRENEARLAAELEDTQLLQELSMELTREQTTEALYEKIVEAATVLMDADFASMQMLEPASGSNGVLRLLAFSGFSAHAAKFWKQVQADSKSTCGAALFSGQRTIVADVETCAFMAGSADLAAYRETGIRAVQTTPLFSRGGKLLGMLSTHWRSPHQPAERALRRLDILARQAADLIERRQAEARLQRNHDTFRHLVENSPFGVYAVDADFRLVQVNPTARSIFGDLPDLIGRGFDEAAHLLWPQDYADEIVLLFRRTLETGTPHFTPERVQPRIDRSATEYYEWQINRIPLPDGRYGVVCYFRDISAQVQARVAIAESERRYRQLAERLEEVVTKRTALLREKLGELEAFSYSISHDMRGPLRSMQGFASALLEEYSDKLDANGRDYLQRIDRGAQRLDLLVRDVLAYSKLAKGDFQLQRVELAEFLRELLDSIELGGGVVEIEKPLPTVSAHPALLSQIFSNLIGNAVKFVKPEIPLVVRIRAEDRGGGVRVWVEDNGIGIAPAHFGRIFEIFGRVHADRRYDGTGIGLAIVKKAAERLGGAVGVESELGRGSRFWVELDRA